MQADSYLCLSQPQNLNLLHSIVYEGANLEFLWGSITITATNVVDNQFYAVLRLATITDQLINKRNYNLSISSLNKFASPRFDWIKRSL